jgi:transposase
MLADGCITLAIAAQVATVTPQQLQELSKAELIEIILEQHALILQLQAQIAELQEQLKRLTRPSKDASNSSVPPSQTRKSNRPGAKSSKKRGPKPGHPGHSRERQAPDTIVECRPRSCARCGADLAGAPGWLRGASQVVEIPPVRPVVIEARRYQATCPRCGCRQTATYPPGLEPSRVFGPQLEALICYFHHTQHVSYERLASLFHGLFGLNVSQGAIANVLARAARRLHPEAEAIRQQVRAHPVIASDETGARVAGRNHWQWVFETPTASYHAIVPSRSGQEIATVLGDAQPEVWLSDLFSAQLSAPATRRQICHAHQLRDLQFAVDAERSAFAYRMQRLLLRAQRLHKGRDRLAPELFARQRADLEKACDRLLAATPPGREARRLHKRYRKHRDALFTFLYRRDVPPDNNGCERALRKSVIHRKVSGGFRSVWGAQGFATMTTVIQTAGKRGQDALSALASYLAPGPPLLALAQPPYPTR